MQVAAKMKTGMWLTPIQAEQSQFLAQLKLVLHLSESTRFRFRKDESSYLQ